MKDLKMSCAMRVFFLIFGSMIWLGIWLTGFAVVHWLLYLPAGFAIFAAVTGICPALIVSNKLFGDKANQETKD
jgi:uncharacterized membrane protein